jgi:hypothetical protein
MSHIQDFMPNFRLREVDHVAVAADPERAFAAVRAVDLYRVPFVRWLFALRVLPDRLMGRGKPAPDARIETITAPGTGFHLLSDSDREVVVGSVGKFWQPKIEFAHVTPETFAQYDIPGWGKLAWSIAAAPREQGGSWITIDLRVDVSGGESWAHFVRYWRLIGPFSRAIRHALLRLYREDLGGVPDDDAIGLPGDDVLPNARDQFTHSVFIEAPPAKVWPWLVQMGCHRAGWYSWDRLDNAGVPSADHLILELQHIAVGDILPASPKSNEGFAVLRVDPERELTLGSPSLLPGGARWEGVPYDATWSFALEPIGDDATHLVVRVRGAYEPSVRTTLMTAFVPLVHDFMEKKQLRTLKQRVEA